MTTDDIWLDREQLRAWVAVVALLETLPNALDRQLRRDTGINHYEYSILAMLSDRDEPVPMNELADVAFGSPSRLSHAARRLEQRGWISRTPSPDDGRQMVATLTELGRRELEAAAPGHVREVRRRVIDPLTAAEFRSLGRIARKIVADADPRRAALLDDLFPPAEQTD